MNQKFLPALAAMAVCLVVLSILSLVLRQSASCASRAGSEPRWVLVSSSTVATVYNAVPTQCNSQPLVTASGFHLEKEKIPSYRIIAMERTMMNQYGLSYGDVVKVEGAGEYDGLWQIHDTMNRRFAGKHKIDFLVPENIRHGKWDNVRVYKKY